ncbi:hypothetical protein F8154_09880 [Alkaliphilus pronyensis]|uniref:Flp pilus assembly protein CpaB n=1 Tax=Alkaliphilus pronyensis TaxID=1482732 RepID=A0A6I0F798_9FIRM|nr:hypothetical protein [Alkaliphilus pronyensis]KAB3534066.1 hypothetical protein F8154_09880 [Alkaliphilus pronyensis]
MKKRLKDIIVIIVFLFISIWVGFYLVPMDNERTRDTTMVVRMNNSLGNNQVVKLSDLEVVEMGSYGLPGDVINDPTEIVGKFTISHTPKGVLALKSMFQNEEVPVNAFLYDNPELDGISFETDLARAVGGIPERGDLVRLIIYIKPTEYGQASKVIMNDELSMLEVVSIVNSKGEDIKQLDTGGGSDGGIPGVITVRANKKQQALIVQGMYDGTIHLALRPRIASLEERLDKNSLDNHERTESSGASLEVIGTSSQSVEEEAPEENQKVPKRGFDN